MKKRLAAAFVLTLAIVHPMYAGFGDVARAIDAQKGVRRVWIPFLGVARMMVRVAAPEGIHDFQLVKFTGTENLDPRELQHLIRTKIGPGFSPLVQMRSKKGEWSFIYARPSRNGNRFELIVFARDDEDTVLVRVDVDAEVLGRQLEEHPRHVTNIAAR